MSSASYLSVKVVKKSVIRVINKTTPCDVLLKTVCRNGFGNQCRFSQIASDSAGPNGRRDAGNGFCGRIVSKNGADFR